MTLKCVSVRVKLPDGGGARFCRKRKTFPAPLVCWDYRPPDPSSSTLPCQFDRCISQSFDTLSSRRRNISSHITRGT